MRSSTARRKVETGDLLRRRIVGRLQEAAPGRRGRSHGSERERIRNFPRAGGDVGSFWGGSPAGGRSRPETNVTVEHHAGVARSGSAATCGWRSRCLSVLLHKYSIVQAMPEHHRSTR